MPRKPRPRVSSEALQEFQGKADLERLRQGLSDYGLAIRDISIEGLVLVVGLWGTDEGSIIHQGANLCKGLGHGAEMSPPEVIDGVIRIVVPKEGLMQDCLYLNSVPLPHVIHLVFR